LGTQTQASEDDGSDKVVACVERRLVRVEGAIRLLGEHKMRRQRAGEDGGRGMHGCGWSRHDKNGARRGFWEAAVGADAARTEHDVDFGKPRLERPRLQVGSWRAEGL
jgi:hypothetical protein